MEKIKMKKKFSTMYTWIIIITIAQVAVLFVLNLYAKNIGTGETKISKYVEQPDVIISDVTFSLPKGAYNISASYDGKYVAYVLENSLNIYDVKKKKLIKTITEENTWNVACYKWFVDRDMLIYSFESDPNYSSEIRVSTYDADRDYINEYESYIYGGYQCRAIDLQFSPKTNTCYVVASTGGEDATVHRYDIMKNLTSNLIMGYSWMDFRMAYLSDNLAYLDINGLDAVKVRHGHYGTAMNVYYAGNTVLLDIDTQDIMYIGVLNDEGKVTAIRHKQFRSSSGTNVASDEVWQEYPLDNPVDSKDIYCKVNENLMVVDRTAGKVLNLKNDKSYNINTDVIQVTANHIVSVQNDGKIKLTQLK